MGVNECSQLCSDDRQKDVENLQRGQGSDEARVVCLRQKKNHRESVCESQCPRAGCTRRRGSTQEPLQAMSPHCQIPARGRVPLQGPQDRHLAPWVSSGFQLAADEGEGCKIRRRPGLLLDRAGRSLGQGPSLSSLQVCGLAAPQRTLCLQHAVEGSWAQGPGLTDSTH